VRSNNKPRRVFAALQASALAIATAIATAPATHADEHDDAFLLALKRNGVFAYGDPAAVVAGAHWACDQLAQGAEREHIIVWLGQHNGSNLGRPADVVFLREAALYYCPEYKTKAGW
jgi:hypothetical protein